MSNLQLVHTWAKNAPDDDKEWKLTLKQNDTDLSWLYVFIRKMRIGSARVKTGGINTVRTEEPYRLKGYSTLVMNHALERMGREKYAMSMLLGIRDFYHRFGYAPIMANTNLFVATEDLLRSDPIVPVSTMKKSDGTAVRRLYNQLNATRTASHVRPNYWTHFAGNFRVLPGIARPLKAVLTHTRALSGYAALAYNEERYVVSEIEGRNINDFKSLAVYIGRSAKRRGIDLVEFRLPYDHPFATYCSTLGCDWKIEHPRNHGVMACITNLQVLFVNLEKELTRRVQKSDLNPPNDLSIETDIGSVALNLTPSSVQVSETRPKRSIRVKIPQMRLTQLIMGYRTAEDLALEPDVSTGLQVLNLKK